MYLNKKRRKDIKITNKLQQWKNFNTKDLSNPMILGYDQIKNTHRFNKSNIANYKNQPDGYATITSTSTGDKITIKNKLLQWKNSDEKKMKNKIQKIYQIL